MNGLLRGLVKTSRGQRMLFLLVMTACGSCLSQVVPDNLCELPFQGRGFTASSSDDAHKVLRTIGEVVPFQTDTIKLFPSSADYVRSKGAVAIICGQHNEDRVIFFDQAYIDAIKGKSDLPRYFVLAHEAAHHINGDTLIGNHWSKYEELAADYAAAVWLTRLGVTRDQLLQTFDTLNFPVASVGGYPTRAERRDKVIEGYTHEATKGATSPTHLRSVNGFPSVILECECGQCEHGGGGAMWVFEGLHGQAMWRYGAVADLVVEKFDGRNFTMRRVDPVGSYSSKTVSGLNGKPFTATYTGTIDGNRHVTADVSYNCKLDGDAPENPCNSSAACPLTSDQVLELGKNAANAGLKSAARQCFRMAASMGNATAQVLVDEMR